MIGMNISSRVFYIKGNKSKGGKKYVGGGEMERISKLPKKEKKGEK